MTNFVPAALMDVGAAAANLQSGDVTLEKLAAIVQASLVPAGTVVSFAGASAPSGWLLCAGQAVSRTTFATLFSAIGTTHGVGDGTSTFNVPDLRGRTVAGVDNMGGAVANRLQLVFTCVTTAGSAVVTGLASTSDIAVGMSAFGPTMPAGITVSSIDSGSQVTLSTGTGVLAGPLTSIRFGYVDGNTLGSAGGSQVHALTTTQLPAHNHPLNSGNAYSLLRTTGGSAGFTTGAGLADSVTNTSNAGGGQPHANVQPTILLNSLIKT